MANDSYVRSIRIGQSVLYQILKWHEQIGSRPDSIGKAVSQFLRSKAAGVATEIPPRHEQEQFIEKFFADELPISPETGGFEIVD